MCLDLSVYFVVRSFSEIVLSLLFFLMVSQDYSPLMLGQQVD